MKVNNIGNKLPGVEQSQNKKLESDLSSIKNKSNEEAKDLGSSAKVHLTTQTDTFKEAKKIASEESVDNEKVARLQSLIDKGQYKVDAEAIADRLVDEHLLMND